MIIFPLSFQGQLKSFNIRLCLNTIQNLKFTKQSFQTTNNTINLIGLAMGLIVQKSSTRPDMLA